VDGTSIRSANDLQERIYDSHPGAQPSLVIERDGSVQTVHPVLATWPIVSY
jgi:S1-C subfamily serine protease